MLATEKRFRLELCRVGDDVPVDTLHGTVTAAEIANMLIIRSPRHADRRLWREVARETQKLVLPIPAGEPFEVYAVELPKEAP